MRIAPAFILGAFVATAAAFAGRASAVQDAPKAAPAMVAVIDINKVIDALDRSKAFVDELKKDGEALRKEISAREEELKKRMTDVSARLNPGTPEYTAEVRKIELEKRAIEFDFEDGRAGLDRKKVKGHSRLYKQICAEAERIADERGYNVLVQMDGDPISEEGESGRIVGSNGLQLQMALRGILWTRKDNEITGAVIEALNAK
jgi:Skp family chaperone for outer membrane proteins